MTPDGPDRRPSEVGLGPHVVDVGRGLGHLDGGDEEQADQRHGQRRRQLHPDRDPAHVHPPLPRLPSLSTPASASGGDVSDLFVVTRPHVSSAPQHAWSSCQTRCAPVPRWRRSAVDLARRAGRRWRASPATRQRCGCGTRDEPAADAEPVRSWTVDEANAALGVGRRGRGAGPGPAGSATGPGAPAGRASCARTGTGWCPPTRRPSSPASTSWRPRASCCGTSPAGSIDFPAQAPSGRLVLAVLAGGRGRRSTWWHWPEDGFAGPDPAHQPPD